jgi:glutathione peroxidase
MKLMKIFILQLLVLGFTLATSVISFADSDFYSLRAKTVNGEHVSFDRYRNKVVLLINFAINCGTAVQLVDIQKLQQQYRHRGLQILAFHSSDFSKTEPEDPAVIKKICQEDYSLDVPIFMMNTVQVGGQDPVFKFLTNSTNEELTGSVHFNFEKFLISKNGELVNRFGPFTGLLSRRFLAAVESALNN